MTRTLFVAFVVLLGLNLVDAAKKGVKNNRGGVSAVLSPLVDPLPDAHSAGVQSDAARVAATGAAGTVDGTKTSKHAGGRPPGSQTTTHLTDKRYKASERGRLQSLRAARAASASQVIVAGGSFTVVRSIVAPPCTASRAQSSRARSRTRTCAALSPACSPRLGAPILALRSLPPSMALRRRLRALPPSGSASAPPGLPLPRRRAPLPRRFAGYCGGRLVHRRALSPLRPLALRRVASPLAPAHAHAPALTSLLRAAPASGHRFCDADYALWRLAPPSSALAGTWWDVRTPLCLCVWCCCSAG